MRDLAELLNRVEGATGPDREIDRALAYAVDGVGTDLERSFYAEKGDAAFIPDGYGLTPMDYRNGDFVRHEWVKGTRQSPGRNEPRVCMNCNGPRPLRSCPSYTASLDAALALCERVRPGAWIMLSGPRKYLNIPTPVPNYWLAVVDVFPPQARGWGATLPLALLAALLRTLIEDKTDAG
jgi:hypothetical protein